MQTDALGGGTDHTLPEGTTGLVTLDVVRSLLSIEVPNLRPLKAAHSDWSAVLEARVRQRGWDAWIPSEATVSR